MVKGLVSKLSSFGGGEKEVGPALRKIDPRQFWEENQERICRTVIWAHDISKNGPIPDELVIAQKNDILAVIKTAIPAAEAAATDYRDVVYEAILQWSKKNKKLFYPKNN